MKMQNAAHDQAAFTNGPVPSPGCITRANPHQQVCIADCSIHTVFAQIDTVAWGSLAAPRPHSPTCTQWQGVQVWQVYLSNTLTLLPDVQLSCPWIYLHSWLCSLGGYTSSMGFFYPTY